MDHPLSTLESSLHVGYRSYYVDEEQYRLDVVQDLLQAMGGHSYLVYCSSDEAVLQIRRFMEAQTTSELSLSYIMSDLSGAKESLEQRPIHIVANATLGHVYEPLHTIINFNFPISADDYILRNGIRARFDRRRLIINLIVPSDVPKMREIETALNIVIEALPSNFVDDL
jgi:hypothetical protein